MISNLKIKFLFLFLFWLMSGCALIENADEKKQTNRDVQVGWESIATSTIIRSPEQGQSFVTWYYRRESGKIKVLACQAIFPPVSIPLKCSFTDFPDGEPAVSNLVWIPNLDNGSHGGTMAWISFYRRPLDTFNNSKAREQRVCSIVWAGEVACAGPITLPQ